VTTHTASCRCGQLRASAAGDPVRVSVCHCLDCQKRSGSAFAAQARFTADAVTITGTSEHYAHSGANGVTRFHFCTECGSEVFYRHDDAPETIAVPIGMFANPHAFTPTVQVYGNRKHPWVAIIGAPEQFD
jgi:hypothetical protein